MFYNDELNTYLTSVQQKLMEEKTELNKRYKQICNHIKENDKFISLLDESNDPNYESFTPRDVNAKNREKINLLTKEKKELENEGTSIKAKIDELIFREDKLANMIKKNSQIIHQKSEEKNSLIEIIRMMSEFHYQFHSQKNELEKYPDDISKKVDSLIHRVELCTRILSLDKMRCKMELAHIADELVEVKKLIEENEKEYWNQKNKKGVDSKEEEMNVLAQCISDLEAKYRVKIVFDSVKFDEKNQNLICDIVDSYFYAILKSDMNEERSSESGSDEYQSSIDNSNIIRFDQHVNTDSNQSTVDGSQYKDSDVIDSDTSTSELAESSYYVHNEIIDEHIQIQIEHEKKIVFSIIL